MCRSATGVVRLAPILTWQFWVVLSTALCWGQTTNGLICGRVSDRSSGRPIPRTLIEYEQLATNTRGTTYSAQDGRYYIPLLPPGRYRVRAVEPAYQSREIYNVILAVAGYLNIDFELRPLHDVWERGRYQSEVFRDNTVLPFFGPDVDPSYVDTFEPDRNSSGQLEPSISEVIDPKAIEMLPLAGRDVYTALVLQPGVTSDTATRRSLGLSANGQRPASSNFLLDGIENNDQLLSGPAIQLPPEMVQEYRVSTNNFSAEYGRTTGYIANAVTRSAASAWHGIAYGDLNNDVLNANSFEHNATGLARNTSHQIEAGLSAGGAVPKTRLFTWTALDFFGSRAYTDPEKHILPTQAFANSLKPGSRASQLLHDHPPVEWATPASGDSGTIFLAQPVTIQRLTGLERLDYALSAHHHLMGRGLVGEIERPDFSWSPYGQAPLSMSNFGTSIAVISAWSPTLTSEVRAGIQTSYRGWDKALANLPEIQILGLNPVALPGACCSVGDPPPPSWSGRARTEELSTSLALSHGAHLVKIGGGLLYARLKSGFRIPEIASFQFDSLSDFGDDAPSEFIAPVSRLASLQGIYQQPDTYRSYRYVQPYAFVQEDWRFTQRLTISAGFRFERFAAPVNDGSVPDIFFAPAGSTGAPSVMQHRGALFTSEANAPSIRLAFSYALFPSRGTVLRGGYGTFYDRSPDNVWITAAGNDLAFRPFKASTRGGCSAGLLQNFYASGHYLVLPPECPQSPGFLTTLNLSQFQTNLNLPRVQSLFLSLQQPFGRDLMFELNGAGSRGRRLLTTDILNREFADQLPNIDFRTDQGFSDYAALSTTIRYRSGPLSFGLAYTWSHSIDNQSDPLLNTYFDLGFSYQTDRTQPPHYYASFSNANDPYVDRGNSDFDQRHNLVSWGSVALPAPPAHRLKPLFRDWTAAWIFAARSGLPFSVTAGPTNCALICNTRANLVNPFIVNMHQPVAEGVQLLNADAFSIPPKGEEGNTGRNAFEGPGFSDLDLSFARILPLRRLGEQVRLVIRADAFNLLNHPNLQSPVAHLPDQNFGVASHGGGQQSTGFPSFTPLIESARQIHFLLRFEF